MKKVLILLKTFPVFFILLQGCNNIEQASPQKKEEKEEKILSFSPDLNDKYSGIKSCCLSTIKQYSELEVKTYSESLIIGKVFSEEYSGFIYNNINIYTNCQCALYNDTLYVEIMNGSVVLHKSILLEIEKNKYEVTTIETSDITHNVFTPQKSTLRTSLNEFHVGDTIVGEISLSYRDSLWNYVCDGHFMGVIDQGTEEWKKSFQSSLESYHSRINTNN